MAKLVRMPKVEQTLHLCESMHGGWHRDIFSNFVGDGKHMSLGTPLNSGIPQIIIFWVTPGTQLYHDLVYLQHNFP